MAKNQATCDPKRHTAFTLSHNKFQRGSESSCQHGKGEESHYFFLGLVVSPTWIRRVRRSYHLQIALVGSLTLALFLLNPINYEDRDRRPDNVLQQIWSIVIEKIPGPASHFLFGSVLACATFVVACLYFSYKDLARHDSKIQKDWWPSVYDMTVAGLPQVIIYIVVNWISWIMFDYRVDLPQRAPSLFEFARDLTIMLIVGDYYIYFEHRTMHHFPVLRDHIHSVHHEYKKVFSWAGGWVHPLEDLAAVVTQVTCPVVFLHPHPLTFWVFVCLWTLLLVDEHSGHDVWWSPYVWLPFSTGGGGAPHDIHHYKPHTNFGFVFCIWDILFCTMKDVTDWYPGKTDFEPWVGAKDLIPVNGFVPPEGWSLYRSEKLKKNE